MQPPPHEPHNFQELVEADLRRAARLIIKVQYEIDWQFRFATPKGDYHLAVTMPNDETQRTSMLLRLETFMQWKQASAFTLAVETDLPLGFSDAPPDAIYALGVSKREMVNCVARITRDPQPWTAANFGPVQWLPESSIDPSLAAMLPRRSRAMTPKLVSALEHWFGLTGKFPAVHVPTGEVKGL